MNHVMPYRLVRVRDHHVHAPAQAVEQIVEPERQMRGGDTATSMIFAFLLLGMLILIAGWWSLRLMM